MATASSKPSLGVNMVGEQSPLLGSDNEHKDRNSVTKHGDTSPQAPQRRRPVPQTIGHRGFKAVAPENTMAAFVAAVEAGVDAIETDLHLTRDGVVVLCHDGTLQRCYGNKARVRDLDWSEISELRTLREPRQPMPRLVDLLKYLEEPGLEDIWLILDIKKHDDAGEIMRRIADALASVPSRRPWSERVTPCCWDATYIALGMKYLPDYRTMHVGFSSISYPRCLSNIPNISFSIFHYTLATLPGRRFLRDMKKQGIPVHVWTVNDESWMEWCIRNEVSGVITDEVGLFRKVCDRIRSEEDEQGKKTLALNPRSLYRWVGFLGKMAVVHLLLLIFMADSWLRHGPTSHRVKKALDG
ncbi:PLC-like phosphodiesterase [Poronia punctata]|nr:PLC-like phosphodiesterase [Poronia punctata]